MKFLKILLLIIFVLLHISFSYAQKRKKGNNINNIITVYLSVKNALIKNDGTTAKIQSKKLYTLFSTQPDQALNNKQANLVADSLQTLLDNTRLMCYTIAENDQRKYFAVLSKSLYGLLKGLKLNNRPLYLQYCYKNKFYWISEFKDIKNPYYNFYDKPNAFCGKTTDSLAVAVVK